MGAVKPAQPAESIQPEDPGRAGVPRATRQRVAVTSLLAQVGDFRSAQQIHAALREGGDTVGLATVYRNLALMARLGEVDVLMREDGEALYRKCSARHHHHLVCRDCGRTVEVAGPAVEAWADEIAAQHGFDEVAHKLELFGRCPACAARASERPNAAGSP